MKSLPVLFLLILALLQSGCSPASDDRFPPYDNAAEAAAFYGS